jgi:hypothetical protein
MYSNPQNLQQPKFLSGWKDIAAYLGKGVRTVQRYERDLGLPVRRPAGKNRAAVVATKAELDAWVGASPIRQTFHLTRTSVSTPESLVQEIRQSVTEMHELREHMAALRKELRASVGAIHASLDGLRMGLSRDRLTGTLRGMTVVDAHHRSEYMVHLLQTDSRRKAS